MNCGTAAQSGAKFCQACGKPHVEPETDQISSATSSHPSKIGTQGGIVRLWLARVFFGILFVIGLALVLLGAVQNALGLPSEAWFKEVGMGLLWLVFGMSYLFKAVPWNQSRFVKKYPIVSGICSTWIIASAIFILASILIHKG